MVNNININDEVCNGKEPISINGRDYTFHPMSFIKARELVGFLTKFSKEIDQGCFDFFNNLQFINHIEPSILECSLCDGVQLSQKKDHFEPQDIRKDYLMFITSALAVFSHPFIKGDS